jgi:hypothetical protein
LREVLRTRCGYDILYRGEVAAITSLADRDQASQLVRAAKLEMLDIHHRSGRPYQW